MGKYKNLGEAAINEVTGNLTLQINNLKKTLVRNDKIIENLKENITCLFNQAQTQVESVIGLYDAESMDNILGELQAFNIGSSETSVHETNASLLNQMNGQ